MCCVLVVDDEPAIRQFVRTILERSGFVTMVAKDGPEALAMLEDPHIDALLTDIIMPGMSGADLVRHALKRRPGLPVCCMTGLADPNDPVLQAFPVITKPFKPGTLVEMVQQTVEKQAKEQDGLPRLQQEMQEARSGWLDSIAELREMASQVPSGVPHPDGALELTRAGQKRLTAFQNYKTALYRYEATLKRSQLRAGEPGQSV